MWISPKRLKRLLEVTYKQGYDQGFLAGQLHAMKQILRWRRILEAKPMGILAEQIEEILRRKGWGR